MDNETDTAAQARDDASVLVVLVNNTRDWETIRREGWYRIPVKRAPQQIGAEYLAFFHSAAIDELKWAVHYYAPVQSVRVTPRRRLLPDEIDHPRANDLYYCVELGPLARLDSPVPSRRLRRVTFIHTTLARLLEAQDVSELWIKQPLRERLWVEFNRQGIHAERQASVQEGNVDYQFDFLIPCQDGKIAVDCRLPEIDDVSAGMGREAPASYPPSADERVLAEMNYSWLRFDDPGWSTNLQPYMQQVWQEITRRGGQAPA